MIKLVEVFSIHRKGLLVVVGFFLFFVLASILILQKNKTRETLMMNELVELDEAYEKLVEDLSLEEAYCTIKPRFLHAIDKFSSLGKIVRMMHVCFGSISYRSGFFDMAISMYSRALELSADDLDLTLKGLVLSGLAHSYLSSEKLDEAILYFEKILLEDVILVSEDAMLNVALLYGKIGKIDRSIEIYKRFLISFPESVYINLIMDKLAEV